MDDRELALDAAELIDVWLTTKHSESLSSSPSESETSEKVLPVLPLYAELQAAPLDNKLPWEPGWEPGALPSEAGEPVTV